MNNVTLFRLAPLIDLLDCNSWIIRDYYNTNKTIENMRRFVRTPRLFSFEVLPSLKIKIKSEDIGVVDIITYRI